MSKLMRCCIGAAGVAFALPVTLAPRDGLAAGTFDGPARLVVNDACAGSCNMPWPFVKCCDNGTWIYNVWCDAGNCGDTNCPVE